VRSQNYPVGAHEFSESETDFMGHKIQVHYFSGLTDGLFNDIILARMIV
jgi:hypothetical protein